MATTQIPAKGARVSTTRESCESGAVDGEKQFVTLINIQDGQAPRTPVMEPDNSAMHLARFEVPPGPLTLLKHNRSIHLRGNGKDNGGPPDNVELAPMPELAQRMTWWQWE